MTDDIVTRLRETATEERPLWRCQMLEAADEIERLREENDKASALIAKLAELLRPFAMLMNKHERELLVKAF